MNLNNIAYAKQTTKNVHQTADALTEALKPKGFGVLNTINVSKIIKEKIGKTIAEYLILEVCNTKDAAHALSLHKEVGLMLPCKIVVYEDNGNTTMCLYRPTEAMKALGITDLNDLAVDIESKLTEVIDSVAN